MPSVELEFDKKNGRESIDFVKLFDLLNSCKPIIFLKDFILQDTISSCVALCIIFISLLKNLLIIENGLLKHG